jgi:uncharacterized protein YhbP (UPF0306 family)
LNTSLERIESFITGHHILMLATSHNDIPQAATLFYAYDPDTVTFVVASDHHTEHIQNLSDNHHVAGTIALETTEIGKIQGIQFKGVMSQSDDKTARSVYFGAFPYARVMNPVLWRITPEQIKLTDNRLGFGKKLNWTREDAG